MLLAKSGVAFFRARLRYLTIPLGGYYDSDMKRMNR